MNDTPVVRGMGETVQILCSKGDYQQILSALVTAGNHWDNVAEHCFDRAFALADEREELERAATIAIAMRDILSDLFERLDGSRSPLYTVTQSN